MGTPQEPLHGGLERVAHARGGKAMSGTRLCAQQGPAGGRQITKTGRHHPLTPGTDDHRDERRQRTKTGQDSEPRQARQRTKTDKTEDQDKTPRQEAKTPEPDTPEQLTPASPAAPRRVSSARGYEGKRQGRGAVRGLPRN
jgi:hypothetical protein